MGLSTFPDLPLFKALFVLLPGDVMPDFADIVMNC